MLRFTVIRLKSKRLAIIQDAQIEHHAEMKESSFWTVWRTLSETSEESTPFLREIFEFSRTKLDSF